METATLNPDQQKALTDLEKNQQQIYHICEKYFELSLRCFKNEDLLNTFQDPAKTVAFLTDGKSKTNEYIWEENGIPWTGCGMKLPTNTKVILDYETSWPTIYFTKKGIEHETITIKESPLFVKVFSHGQNGIKTLSRELLSESDELKVVLPFDTNDLKNYDAILIMPCFIPNKDMLTKVYCSDNKENAEIILTSC
ncbi:hypothetical protein [Aquimarina algicola]|uniref:Uncharacterized protein n=1 Tax=Aquimarina algicola TaxID=2589995 RepID=A0A504JE48_9FLAO|nr:hypothetical protein [Aquimarina algicola]TPN85139.1 hypothetical protein FHK87_13995 [Aquimarina algicola]